MNLRQGERAAMIGATATGFLVLVAHALLETARDALFLSNVPAARLPWMYLVLAVLGICVSEAAARTSRRADVRRLLLRSQAIAAAGTLAMAVLLAERSVVAYYTLYLWVGVASMSVLVRYWQHLSGTFTATDAKRLFPLIGTGSVAGALAGYALADVLARTVGVAASLPVAAGFFALSMLGPFLFFTSETREEGEGGETASHATIADSLRAVLSHDYLRRVAATIVIAAVTLTLSDFVFKSVVAREVDAEHLGAFFARTYFAFNGASLFVLVALVNPILRRLGVTRTLAVLPAALLAGSLGVMAAGGLVAAVALKGADGALRFSTHKTALELLYVPISRGLRDTVKTAIDVLAQRLGQALGSVLILLLLVLSDSPALPAALVACASVAWILLAVNLKEEYLDLFRDALSGGPADALLEFPELDVGSLETLVAALNSQSDRKVLAALDLLEQKSKGHLVPGLLLYHPSPAVVTRALDLFARIRREDILPFLPRLSEHEYAEVRAAALRAASAIAPDEAVLRRGLEHHCPVVNVTALVGLTVGGWIPAAQGVEELRRHAEADSELVRPMIARAVRYHPLRMFAPVLTRLAGDPDPETRREAVLAMRAAHDIELAPALMRALGDRALREDARDALVDLGAPALSLLEAALADASTPSAVRVHLPRTIARFQGQRAADILVQHLRTEERGIMRYRSLRGLGRLIANDPSLRLDKEACAEVLDKTIVALFERLHWQVVLEQGAQAEPARRTPGHELLLQLLRDKEALAIERLFRLIGLCYPSERWADVYEALCSEDATTHSSGRELLESALPRELATAIVALTSRESAADRLAAGANSYQAAATTYEELIELLTSDSGVTVKLIARYHAVEIGLRPDPTTFVRSVDEEPGWIDTLRELATRMQRDLPPPSRELRSDA